MAQEVQAEIATLLAKWRHGHQLAFDQLIPLVHSELRRIAARHMRRESPGHTLQTTALLNEAYLRLAADRPPAFENRTHFFAIASHVMRRILVDYARKRWRQKRSGGAVHVNLDEASVMSPERSEQIIELEEALERLWSFDPRKCQTVEMRFFGGMSVEETAKVLGVSPNTVIRDWSMARAWLRREMGTKASDGS